MESELIPPQIPLTQQKPTNLKPSIKITTTKATITKTPVRPKSEISQLVVSNQSGYVNNYPNTLISNDTERSVESIKSLSSIPPIEENKKLINQIPNIPTSKLEILYRKASELYRIKLMKKILNSGKNCHYESLEYKHHMILALKYGCKHSYGKAFKGWLKYIRHEKQIKDLLTCAKTVRLDTGRKEALVLGSDFKESSKRKKEMLRFYYRKLGGKVINYWREYLEQNNEKKNLLRYVNEYYKEKLQKKSFKILQFSIENRRYKRETLAYVINWHRDNLLTKSIKSLRLFIYRNQPFIKKRKIIQRKKPSFMLAHFMNIWIKRCLEKRVKLQKCFKFIIKRKLSLKKKILEAWILGLLKRKTKRENSRKISEIIDKNVSNRIVSQMLRNGVDIYRSKIAYKLMKRRADKIAYIKVLKKYFNCFSLNKFIRRMKKSIKSDAINFYIKNIQKLAMKHFKEHHLLANLKRRRFFASIKFWSKVTYTKGFKSLLIYRNYRKDKKELENHAKELHIDNLRKDAMTLGLKVGLHLRDQKEGIIRVNIKEKEEKSWKLARKYAEKWLEKVRGRVAKREKIAALSSKIPPMQTVNPVWVDSIAPIKQRRAPRRLDGIQTVTKIDSPPKISSFIPKPESFLQKPEPIPRSDSFLQRPNYTLPKSQDLNLSKTNEFDLSAIIRRPIRAPSPFAMTEKIEMTPISHVRSHSQFNSPQIQRGRNLEDRIAEIETILLNLKYDKEKLREFQSKLQENPSNIGLERQIYEVKRKLQEEMPNVRALYEELKYLKNQ